MFCEYKLNVQYVEVFFVLFFMEKKIGANFKKVFNEGLQLELPTFGYRSIAMLVLRIPLRFDVFPLALLVKQYVDKIIQRMLN